MHVNIHFLLLDSPMGTCSSFFSTVRLWRGLICFTQCQQKYHTTFRINMLKINKNITRDTTRSKLEMKGIGCTNEAIERKGWWQCNLFQFISGRFSSDTAWLEPNEYLSSLMLYKRDGDDTPSNFKQRVIQWGWHFNTREFCYLTVSLLADWAATVTWYHSACPCQGVSSSTGIICPLQRQLWKVCSAEKHW